MPGGINLASKYISYIDEQFEKESQVALALTNKSEFKGDKTFKIYSFPIVPLVDYVRSGSSRYGTPNDLARNVQTVTVTQDKAFNYIVDAGDKLQSENLTDAGKQLTRQNKLVVIPYYDTYCFKVLAEAAQANGGYATTAITKSNAYEMFLAGQQFLGDRDVPDQGRVAFCTYAFANFLKQDPAFMKYGNLSQEMINKGVIGEVDGCKIVKVAPSRLPAGAAFIITHPIAATAPKQLDEYKIHDNPPGISGWLVEARIIFDCFVFDNKVDAIYYHGGQSVLKRLRINTAATDTGKSTIVINSEKEVSTDKWYYVTAATQAALTAVTYGSAITTGNWTELTAAQTEITPTAGHKYVRVVEVKAADDKPVAVADTKLNIGE